MIIALSSEITVMKKIADILWRDKSIIYIDTASNGQKWDKTWLENQIWAIQDEYSNFHRYSIEWKNILDFKTDLKWYDIIHIWWGQTAYLLYHITKSWFDVYLKEIQETKIIIGSSAGAKILGQDVGHVQALDDFTIVDLKNHKGLGLLNFDLWVHFWKEKYKEKYSKVLDIAYKDSQKWVFISDDSFIVSNKNKIEFYNT